MSDCSLLAVGLAAGIIALSIQPGEAATRKGKGPFAPVQDKPGLPRVLLIGDSISIGYTLPVRKLLAGKANVHRAPTNCGPTTRGLAQLDKWLGNGKWNVIHFNWGLHDLKYMDDRGRLVPVEKGHQQVPIEQYAKNLEELVKRLKKTGAKLIWASTTPVPEGATGRVKGDEVRYNAAGRNPATKERPLHAPRLRVPRQARGRKHPRGPRQDRKDQVTPFGRKPCLAESRTSSS